MFLKRLVTYYMAFTFLAFCYILALIASVILVFFAIYHIISFDELKTDHKNPIEQCNNLNPLVLPEYCIHGFLVFLFALMFQWGTVLFNAPLLAYNINRYLKRPVLTRPGLYDPTTIMNSKELSRAMKEGWVKMGFDLISFFYYLYCMIYVLVSN